MGTVYAVAFRDDRFLMVFNTKRNGWEMPGGHIEEGESLEDAIRREFFEEAGYGIDILDVKDIGHCSVCACLLLEKKNDSPEMKNKMFSRLPDNLAFERSEYEMVLEWANSVIRSRKR